MVTGVDRESIGAGSSISPQSQRVRHYERHGMAYVLGPLALSYAVFIPERAHGVMGGRSSLLDLSAIMRKSSNCNRDLADAWGVKGGGFLARQHDIRVCRLSGLRFRQSSANRLFDIGGTGWHSHQMPRS